MIRPDGILEVRCPLRLKQSRVDDFIREKDAWIGQKLKAQQNQVSIFLPLPSEYKQLAKETTMLTELLMPRFASLRPTRITIGRQRKRWGSCNSKGYIRINACLSLLPEPLAEYIIAHELCHLVHLNHSADFHNLLQQLLPDARVRQRALSRYHLVDQTPSDR